jgi:hypothetical protein
MRANSNNCGGRLERSSRAWLAPLAALALIGAAIDLSGTLPVRADDPFGEDLPPAQSESPVEFLPQPTSVEATILLALDRPTTFEFVQKPLQDVINDLKDLHDIEIRLDDKALVDAGIAMDMPITLSRMNGIRFKTVLELLRRQYGLYHLIQDEMLLLTSKEVAEAEENMIIRVYPVADLIDQAGFNSLIELITETVHKDSWEDCGTGKGKIEPSSTSKSLVIAQTRHIHDQVLQLLRSLRSARRLADTAVGSK